jgi:hypothetical protein
MTPSQADLQRLSELLPDFLDLQFNQRGFDFAKALEATEFSRLRFSVLGSTFVGFADTRADLIVHNVSSDDGMSAVAGVFFAIDLTLEIFGLILGIIGIDPPRTDIKKYLDTFEKMADQPWWREAWEKLIHGLKQKNPGAIMEFLESLEGSGNIGEIFTHLLSGIPLWEYIFIVAKIIAWIVAATAGGPAVWLAKLASIVADLAGIYYKVKHFAEEVGATEKETA